MKNGIKQTVEYASYIHSIYAFVLAAIAFLLLQVLCFLPLYFDGYVSEYIKLVYFFSLITLVIFGPFIIYFVCQIFSIISIGKEAKIAEVKLDHGECAFRWNKRFLIQIADESGTIKEKKNYRYLRSRTFVKYTGHTVRIYYLDDYDYFFIIKEKEGDL